jgi:hypothetical protein
MNPEYIEPTTQSRRKGISLGILTIALYLLIDLIVPIVMAHVNSLPLCQKITWLNGITILFGILIIIASFSMAYRIRELIIHKQIPLPNAPVFVRQRIYRNWRVKLDMATCLVIILVFCGGYIWSINTAPTKMLLFESVPECVRA